MKCFSDPVEGVDVSFAEEELEEGWSSDEDEDIELEPTTSKATSSIPRIYNIEEADAKVLKDSIHLVYLQCIIELANTPVRNTCQRKGCSRLLVQTKCIGTALHLRWVGKM